MPNGGVVWIRKTVKLPVAGKGFNLKVGLAQDLDTVYFNGEQVGVGNWTPPYFWLQDQYVPIPGRLVKAGDNVIAIRILCQKGRNEAFGLGDRLDLPVANPRTVSNEWLAKVETAFPALPPGGMASLPQPSRIRPEWVPSTLFNGMVYPLTRMAVKGAIWYQGGKQLREPVGLSHVASLVDSRLACAVEQRRPSFLYRAVAGLRENRRKRLARVTSSGPNYARPS